jgi:hypothetical protein
VPTELYRSLEDRVLTVRRALTKTRSFNSAMTVLCMADQETLRAIESDFYAMPGKQSDIRTRLASAHVVALQAPVCRTTERVTPDFVAHLSRFTLEEYLTGHTDLFPDTGGQYRFTLLRHEHDLDGVPVGDVFEVTTMNGYDPRRFRVTVAVKEIEHEGE